MKTQFPRTNVGGLSLSRMIIGTNWLAGWSHTGAAADAMIREHHSSTSTINPMLEAFMSYGVDTVMAPFGIAPVVVKAIKETEQKLGKKIYMVDTPSINVENTAEGRRTALGTIRKSRENGADLCLIHHAACEKLVSKATRTIDRIDDYTKMIRDEGMIPGLSAHMPEIVKYSDLNEYDVETYIQIYNCMGFLMQVEVESVNKIIHSAKKPVMTIKPMAAGRCTPFVGLNFSWATIRDCDMVTCGCFSEKEALEDIEISLAALERRPANLGHRSSPVENQDAFGNN